MHIIGMTIPAAIFPESVRKEKQGKSVHLEKFILLLKNTFQIQFSQIFGLKVKMPLPFPDDVSMAFLGCTVIKYNIINIILCLI